MRGRAALAALVLVAAADGGRGAAAPRTDLSRQQAALSTLGHFFAAFNAHHPAAALTWFTNDPRYVRYVGANDCDYRTRRTVGFSNRAQVSGWLKARARDHDRLVVANVRLIGTRPAGAAISYRLRQSDTLRSLGHPQGIVPDIATKVGFTTRGPVRITQFASAAGTDRPCGP